MTLPNGQSVATITLSIRDDKEPEFDEVTYIRLTEIVDDGTTLDTKGARLGMAATHSCFLCKATVPCVYELSLFFNSPSLTWRSSYVPFNQPPIAV